MSDKPKVKGPAARLAAQIRADGGADETRKACKPALKAQPKPDMGRKA